MTTTDREEGPARRRRREVRERIEAEELAAAAKAEPATLGRHDEPQHSGAVVAVNYGDYRTIECWIRSGANIGNWYPLGGEFGCPTGEVPLHPHWEDVLARGPVTLLVPGDQDAYSAGWRNGRRRMVEQMETVADDDE